MLFEETSLKINSLASKVKNAIIVITCFRKVTAVKYKFRSKNYVVWN